MTCCVFCALLADYLDGELCPRDAEALLLHAAACSACRCYLQGYRLTVRALAACAGSLDPGAEPGVP